MASGKKKQRRKGPLFEWPDEAAMVVLKRVAPSIPFPRMIVKRRLPSFRLRSLLIAVAGLAVLFALVRFVRDAEYLHALLERSNLIACLVEDVNSNDPISSRHFVLAGLRDEAISLRPKPGPCGAGSSCVSDADLQWICTHVPTSSLRDIELLSPSISGAGLSVLERFDRLEVLEIHGLDSNQSISEFPRLPELTRLRLTHVYISDSALKSIGSLPKLRVLDLTYDAALYFRETTDDNRKFGREAMAAIGNATSLERLYLDDRQITDGDTRPLAKLVNLKTLSLANNRLTNAALAHLTRLVLLEQLNLDGIANVHDCRSFKQMPNLKSLSIRRAILDRDFGDQLGQLARLHELDLAEASAATGDFEELLQILPKLRHLKKLSLRRCVVTAKAIPLLAEMPWLEELDVFGTGITAWDGGDALRKSLPKTKITWY